MKAKTIVFFPRYFSPFNETLKAQLCKLENLIWMNSIQENVRSAEAPVEPHWGILVGCLSDRLPLSSPLLGGPWLTLLMLCVT